MVIKPTVYNTRSVYDKAGKGGSVYNGIGVYDMGVKYNGPFIFLNNFDNVENDEIVSKLGANIYAPNGLSGSIVSSYFPGDNAYKVSGYYNSMLSQNIADELNENIYTIEICVSSCVNSGNVSDIGTYEFRLQLDSWGGQNRFRIFTPYYGGNYSLFNGASYINSWGTSNIIFGIGTITGDDLKHFAAVIDINNKNATMFFNGVKKIECTLSEITKFRNILIQRQDANYTNEFNNEFICIRKGDFSNNLASFTVPVQKYSL